MWRAKALKRHADEDGDGIVSVGTFFTLTHRDICWRFLIVLGRFACCMLDERVGNTIAVGTRAVTVAVIAGLCRVV